ncbi:cytochrome C and Quinol oxidase polypeptide I family protein [Mycobacterium kansasii 824]|nr:cytochrome C and Quinol oxidase polypeptide I family protein [Mycobacterium kansasii 824]
MVTTTDHKTIGVMYVVTSYALFFVAGLMALLIRTELAAPGLQFLSNEQYNQLFTMHGTIMLLLYATPIVFGFANLVLPLQIGAPDVAFPRLNAFSYWLFLFGALITLAGFITPGGAADFGWTAYTPLSNAIHSPGAGGDLWIMGLIVAGLGTILGAVNMITTVVSMRAPGMTMFRMPIFTWNILVTSILVLIAFPPLTAALFALAYDRHLGPISMTRQTAAQFCGSTCSGSSAIRGLHRGAAVLRDRYRDHPGVQPQTNLRLHHLGVRHSRDCRAVDDGVGSSHVRHRSRSPAVSFRSPRT